MLTVREVMTQPALTVRADTPLKEVAQLLVDHRISGVPVVDPAGHVLGVVSEADFLVKEQGPTAVHHRPLAWLLGDAPGTRSQARKVAATSAGEAMTAPAVTIDADRSVPDAAALMTDRAINRLPVVADGVLVGVVSRADLVRAYVRSDEQLADVIRSDVLSRTMWLNPVLFEVVVRNGIVHLRGEVQRRSTAEIIERVTRMVPGVVGVTSELTWSIDDREFEAPERDMVSPYTER